MDTRMIHARPIVLLCFLLLPLLAVLTLNPGVYAYTPRGDLHASGTETGGETAAPPIAAQLQELAGSNYGSYGIYLNVLGAGEQAGYREDEVFSAASCYKLFLVMYIYEGAARGEMDLDRVITLQAADLEGEEGMIQNSGSSFTTRECCRYAVVYSDNVAARMLKRVYGYHKFRDYARSIGCPVAGTYHINSTTAREMGILLMRVLQFAETDSLGQEVVTYLEESTSSRGIPAGLPQGVAVGNKTGNFEGYYNDAAVVFLGGLTYVLCVMSKGAPGFSTHAEASRLVYEYITGTYYGDASAAFSIPPSQRWFFAHASTAANFETWLCLTNGEKSTAITYIRPLGETGSNTERRICVPPRSTISLRMNQLFGMGKDLALSVESDLPIAAEEAAYYACQGGMLGNSMLGAEYAATEWYIPGGSTTEGYETWLYLSNPGESEAHPVVSAMTAGARSSRYHCVVPARGKVALLLNDIAGVAPDVAVCVVSDAPVLVDQAVYE
ncbi:MAG: serine hydrolase [Actinobacteria bacterium]|nr:serine hydrolase [Actinomycetota bacterium]